jgi:hypothetical protein
VFLNHPQLSSYLDQNDENILQYLKRVDVEEVKLFTKFFLILNLSFSMRILNQVIALNL